MAEEAVTLVVLKVVVAKAVAVAVTLVVVLKAVAVTLVVLKVIVEQHAVLKVVAVTLVVLKVIVEHAVLKGEVLKVRTEVVEEQNSRVPLNLKVHLNANKRINIKLPNNTLLS